MGQATNTDWRTATKAALQKLGNAYQDIRKLNDLNDKLKAEKSTNRRKEIIVQITSLKAKIVAEQIEAWELIRNAGQKLGIVLDGIYDAAPKITPDP
jgi:predicted  nucleic acid-binding Zn-ribbon protein